MEAICGHGDNITPTILLDSSKDDDPSDHYEGEAKFRSWRELFVSLMETLNCQRPLKVTHLYI